MRFIILTNQRLLIAKTKVVINEFFLKKSMQIKARIFVEK